MGYCSHYLDAYAQYTDAHVCKIKVSLRYISAIIDINVVERGQIWLKNKDNFRYCPNYCH